MISRKMKFLSAAVVAAALVATVAVARTVHTHAVPANHASNGHVSTGADQTTPPRRHGIIVCGMAIDSDCEKIETLLPM